MCKLQLLAGLAQLLAGSISLLCQLLDSRLELLRRRRLLRHRRLGLSWFGARTHRHVLEVGQISHGLVSSAYMSTP
jgi:hypothetical protein